jgi:hypothetical protein
MHHLTPLARSEGGDDARTPEYTMVLRFGEGG